MKFTAEQIADILEGEVKGNSLVEVSTLSKIEEGKKESLSFLANPKYTPYIYTTEASVVIVGKDFVAEKEVITTLSNSQAVTANDTDWSSITFSIS